MIFFGKRDIIDLEQCKAYYFITLWINVKKDVEMAEIMGTVTSVKRYLSPEKIELKIIVR